MANNLSGSSTLFYNVFLRKKNRPHKQDQVGTKQKGICSHEIKPLELDEIMRIEERLMDEFLVKNLGRIYFCNNLGSS